jgi:anti-sigma factor RsiW
MNCNGVKEHLVDFLYEELPPDARAAFAEHVSGCAACKAEVASYRHTLGNARAALSGPLSTEPPARVYDAVMKAATAAAAKAAQPATQASNLRRADSSEPGFFARLLGTPWLLPAFGAASVATVVFLVRVLKNPEVIPGQRATSIEERALPAAEKPTLAPAEEMPAAARPQRESEQAAESKAAETTGVRGAKAVRAQSEAPMIRKRKTLADDPLAGLGGLEERARNEQAAAPQEPPREKKSDGAGLGQHGSAGAGAGARRFAEPPPPRRAPGGAADGFWPETKQESSRAGGAAKDEAQSNLAAKKASRDVDVLLGDFDRPRSAPAPATQMAAPKALAAPRRPAAAAVPTPPAPSPVAAAAEAPMPTAPAASSGSAESERASRSWAPAPPPVAASASGPPAQAKPAQAANRGFDKLVEAAPEADDATDAKMAKGQPGSSLDESIRKADRLFADQSWSAAAEAYRDLVRRFPGHKDATKWRARIDQALVAEGEGRKTGVKAAKAKSADDAAAAAKQ